MSPREEPDAGKPHIRICEGGGEKSSPLLDQGFRFDAARCSGMKSPGSGSPAGGFDMGLLNGSGQSFLGVLGRVFRMLSPESSMR